MRKRFEIIEDTHGSLIRGRLRENIIWRGTPSQLTNIKCYLLCGLFSWLIIPLFIMFWYYLKTKYSLYELTTERLITTKESIELKRSV